MRRRIIRFLGLSLLLLAVMTVGAFATEGDGTVAVQIDATGAVIETYSTLEQALENAVSGDVVRLEQNLTLEQDLTVPEGVTLLLPCIDSDPGYVHRTHDGQDIWFNQDADDAKYLEDHVGVGKYAYCHRTLTVPDGVTLTVNGTVMVNAVTGRRSGGHNDMDVTGGYFQINLAGEIVVNNGGVLENFGYIKGDGLVTAKNGGTVGDLYIVRNWRGGTLGEKMYNANVYPMNESDCRNIESDIRIEYGGSLMGLVKMSAALSTTANYYYTRFPQVDVGNGLVRMTSEDGYVLRSYNSEKEREIYEIHGGAQFAHSSLNILGMDLSTAYFIYPIDGDMDYILADGQYDFVNDFKFLTGSTMKVEGTANLNVKSVAIVEDPNNKDRGDGIVTVVFYDKFKDKPNTSTTQYPNDLPAATLTLEDGAVFTNESVFAGTIVAHGGRVVGEEGAVWTVQTKEANGYALIKPYIVRLNFKTVLVRDADQTKYEKAGDEIRTYIGGPAVERSIERNAETGALTVTAKVDLAGTVEAGKTCKVLVTAYSEDGKVLNAEMRDVTVGENGEPVIAIVELSANEQIAVIKTFVLGQEFVPLTFEA